MEASLRERLQAEETRLAAFEELVKAYYPRVKRWIQGWVKDPQWAEDLTQETFLRAWEKCHTFRGEAAFSSWLYTLARRETMRALQKSRRLAWAPWPQDEEGFLYEPPAEPSLDYERFERDLAATVAELSERQRTVFQAAWEEHLPYKEIAARLGLRENTVKAHLFHIRQRLWRRLRTWLGEE